MHASTEPQTTPQIGDVVELKSGGPYMTIAELDTGAIHKFSNGASYALDADVRSVTCLWFDQGEVRMGKFIPQILRLAR